MVIGKSFFEPFTEAGVVETATEQIPTNIVYNIGGENSEDGEKHSPTAKVTKKSKPEAGKSGGIADDDGREKYNGVVEEMVAVG